MITAQISLIAFYASKVILGILVFLSFFVMAFFLERILFFKRNSLRDGYRLFDDIEAAESRKDIEILLSQAGRAETAVILRGLNQTVRTHDDFYKKVQAALAMEKEEWERFSAFLGTVGSNAPFVGLLGTVLGIMKSFADLSTATSAGGTQAVMSGISEALIATAVGLAVAIPAIICFNICKSRVKKSVSQVNVLADLIGSKNIF